MRFTTRVAASLLALVMGPALADGVPLISPGAALSSTDLARSIYPTKQPDFVKEHPIMLNRAAFGSNVLIVNFDGRDYRFTGAMMAKHPPPPKAVPQPDTDAWSGTEPGGGTLTITKDLDHNLFDGSMHLPPNRFFHFATGQRGSLVLVELDGNFAPPPSARPASAPVAVWPAAPPISASGVR